MDDFFKCSECKGHGVAGFCFTSRCRACDGSGVVDEIDGATYQGYYDGIYILTVPTTIDDVKQHRNTYQNKGQWNRAFWMDAAYDMHHGEWVYWRKQMKSCKQDVFVLADTTFSNTMKWMPILKRV